MLKEHARMASTTLTSKGQMTLPKEIRDRFNLKSGDRLNVSADGNRIVLVPSTLQLDQLCAVLPLRERRVTIAEMEGAVRLRAARRLG